MRRLILILCLGCAVLGPTRSDAALVDGTVRPIEWAPEVEVCLAETEFCAAPEANGLYQLGFLKGLDESNSSRVSGRACLSSITRIRTDSRKRLPSGRWGR